MPLTIIDHAASTRALRDTYDRLLERPLPPRARARRRCAVRCLRSGELVRLSRLRVARTALGG